MATDTDVKGVAKQTASIVNSVLLFATLGMLAFIGNGTIENSKKLESIAASQITRGEFETKIAELRQEQNKFHTKLIELEIVLATINASRKP